MKNADAGELYCGSMTGKLTKRWPLVLKALNRRGEGQSFKNDATFRGAVDQAYQYNLPAHVTVNGLYTLEQYSLPLKLIESSNHFRGVKRMIVADVGLFLTLKKTGFEKEIHKSYQFTSEDFVKVLRDRKIQISMDGRGRALDDIFVGRLWRSMKYENVYLKGYETIPDAEAD